MVVARPLLSFILRGRKVGSPPVSGGVGGSGASCIDGRSKALSQLFGLPRRKAAIHARLVTKVAAFLAVICVIFIGPRVLNTTRVSPGIIFIAAYLVTNVNDVTVKVFTGLPITLTPTVKLGTFFTFIIIKTVNVS